MKEQQIIDLVVDYKKTFETEHGKRVLMDIVSRCNLLSTSYSETAHEMAFNEGKRWLGLLIWNNAERELAELRDSLRIMKQQRNET